jgi:uncharacterized protein YjbJ (UPF0337 family)
MGRSDEAKGRGKEALGDLTDNDKLKKEGRSSCQDLWKSLPASR